jgi:chromosomal replication initiation ATPase DnaA
MPTHEFHSLLQKMKNEQRLIFDDVVQKKQNPNERIYLFITGGVGIGKTFTLMFLIQALVCFIIDILL